MSEKETEMQDATQGQAQPKPKKKHRRRTIAIVVVAVVAVAGLGFNAWHSTPEFCGAICHDPMDAYVPTYTEGTVDKYGNDLDEMQSMGMMSHLHEVMTSEDGTSAATCLDCHEPTIGEQVTEGIHWVTGSFDVAGVNQKGDTILVSRTFDQLTEARGSNAEAFCLKSGCHVNEDGSDMTRADLIAATADLSETRNPHLAQHGELACGTCHKGHSQSVNYCSQCHTDAPIPEGWVSYAEAEERGIL